MDLTKQAIEDLILTKLIEDFVKAPKKSDDDSDDDSLILEDIFSQDELKELYASGNWVKYEEPTDAEDDTSIDDVLNEMFANGSVDRDSYVKSIMELTKIGYVNSDLKNEEDVKDSELNGFEINGLTDKGRKYVNKVLADEKMQDDLKKFYVKSKKIIKYLISNGIIQNGIALAGIIQKFIE